MIVFRGYQAMDVFGPLDVLNTLSGTIDKLNLSIIASSYDPVNTSSYGNNFSESIVPTHTFDNPPSNLDVLIIPGGGGTHAAAPQLLDAIAYIKETYPKLKYIISVCTGATLLARAGILDGKHATTNKAAWAWAITQGPNTTWEPVARWVVDGNVWTTSGISAGLDGIYAYVGHIYGEPVSLNISNMLEYERHTNASWDPYGKLWGVPGA
jgi:putative intracellular protease/amidase